MRRAHPALEKSCKSLHHPLNTNTCPFPRATASPPRCGSSSKSWPLAMSPLASPGCRSREPRWQPCSRLPPHGESSLGWLICGGPSHHHRLFQPGTSVSAAVGPHPKKTRITSQRALSLWPELWSILHRVYSRAGTQDVMQSWAPPRHLPAHSSTGLYAHAAGVYHSSSGHSIILVHVMPSDSQVSGSTTETPEPAHSRPRK